MVVVASAGNYGLNQETGEVGYAGIASPGNAPSAITVGAVDMHDTADRGDDTVTPYSSRGPAWYSGLAKPDLVAPGHRLVAVGAYNSWLYERTPSAACGDGRGSQESRVIFSLSGTSMAAAVTSGVVALMVQANRETYDASLTPERGESDTRVHGATSQLRPMPLTQGAGGLNGAGAVLLAEVHRSWRATGNVVDHRSGRSLDRDRRPFHGLVADGRVGQYRRLGERRLRQSAGLGTNGRVGIHRCLGEHGCLGKHRSRLGRSVPSGVRRSFGETRYWARTVRPPC